MHTEGIQTTSHQRQTKPDAFQERQGLSCLFVCLFVCFEVGAEARTLSVNSNSLLLYSRHGKS